MSEWKQYTSKYASYQIKFCEDMEKAGMGDSIIPDYSGRGMYGAICPAVTTSDNVTKEDIRRATKVTLKCDGMGMESVLYAE